MAEDVKSLPTKEQGISALLNQDDSALAQSLGLEHLVKPLEEAKEVVAEEEEVVEEKAEEKPEEKPKEKPEAEEKPEEKPEEEPKKLLTEFVMKQDGQEVDIPSDVTFDLKANNKDYKDVPLDKVVLLAQMGFYNQQREEEVLAAKQFVSETTQENQQLREVVSQLRQEFEDLLADERYREAAVEEYEKSNTPESRARRAEEQLRHREQEVASERERTQAQSYIATQIYPAVKQLLQEFPTVSEDEVIGRFNRLISPLMVNGIVPFSKLSEVKGVVSSELRNWAQAQHLERDAAQTKTAKTIDAEKTKTAMAKRQVARQVAPAGKPGRETRKQTTYKSAEEWVQKGLDEILSD